MKYLIVSDIHGDYKSAEFIYHKFKEEKYDYILCLGDVLYHGPRNDLPEYYGPKQVIALLNDISDKIICVKGNCDAEVDQMVLNFKIIDFYDAKINGLNAHLEHGHHFDQYTGNFNIVLSGHTHIPVLKKENQIIYLNPGSITLPKNGSKKGYAVWNENKISLITIDEEIIKEIIY